MTGGGDRRGTIVVGVDGSESSLRALAWAVAEADLRGAEVDLLHSWSYAALGYEGTVAPMLSDLRDELVAEAQAVLDDACSAVAHEGVVVHPRIAHGSPARSLIDAAEGADLLVVGSRGRGGFRGLLLGSVSQQCAPHAPCPVVIVH